MADDKQPRVPKKNGGSALWVVPDPGELPPLSALHLAELRASGLDDDTIRAARLHSEARQGTLQSILGRRYDVAKQGSALVFPFWRGDGSHAGARIKPSHPRVQISRQGKRRTVKYDQNSSDGTLIYWEPRALQAGRFADASVPIVFTEGEKKALALGQLGYCAVGLTGVWNWLDAAADEAVDGRKLHPELVAHLPLTGRQCTIVYDADAVHNDQVMLAAKQLGGQLLAAGARSVRFCCPPESPAKGIDDYLAAHGEEATRALVDGAADLERPIDPKSPLQRVRDFKALRGAPADVLSLLVPPGYTIRRDGSLWSTNPDPEKADKQVALGVILIAGYQVDLDNGEHRVEVVFLLRGSWRSVVVDAKATVERGSMLAELAPHLAPVTGNNAAAIIDWIAAYKSANEDTLRTRTAVRRLGWAHVHGQTVFCLDVPLAAKEITDVVVDTRGDHKHLVASLVPCGTYHAHLDALRTAWDASPTCALLIAASLGAPLLEKLGAPNFAIHLAGDSSRGKTSMLCVAASVWGDPDPDGHWISSWDATTVGAELRAAACSGLPLCFDEVGATDTRTLERMVYMLINGTGRMRGNRDVTLRETLSWRSILLSTGEHPLASEETNTGAQVRVIQPHVVNFGRLTAAEIDALRVACAENHGQVGRKWITDVLDTDVDTWATFREGYRKNISALRGTVEGDTLAQRQSTFFGFLSTVESLAHAVLGIGKADGSTVANYALDSGGERQQIRPLDERALDEVRDWMASEPGTFFDLGLGWEGNEAVPAEAATARVVNGYVSHDGYPMFVPSRLRDYLRERGMAPLEVLRAWESRGWLQRQGRQYGRQIRAVGSRLIELRGPDSS